MKVAIVHNRSLGMSDRCFRGREALEDLGHTVDVLNFFSATFVEDLALDNFDAVFSEGSNKGLLQLCRALKITLLHENYCRHNLSVLLNVKQSMDKGDVQSNKYGTRFY
ncbi:hypothetical protein FACS1894122_11770 [Alphaproteobacteria bacterium]|nr:hypothetical protein FACS1894122_11770 [Alphaproteobacteria bacterium]